MQKTTILFLMLTLILPLPVRAGIEPELAPIEQDLIDKQKQIQKKLLEDEMNSEFRKKQKEQPAPLSPPTQQDSKRGPVAATVPSTGSGTWKWIVPIVIIGGAVAASGRSDNGSDGNTPANTGSVHIGW